MTDDPSTRRHRRRCMVTDCRERGRWETLPPGVLPLPTDHPDSHYSKVHAVRVEDITPRSQFNPDGTRRG